MIHFYTISEHAVLISTLANYLSIWGPPMIHIIALASSGINNKDVLSFYCFENDHLISLRGTANDMNTLNKLFRCLNNVNLWLSWNFMFGSSHNSISISYAALEIGQQTVIQFPTMFQRTNLPHPCVEHKTCFFSIMSAKGIFLNKMFTLWRTGPPLH